MAKNKYYKIKFNNFDHDQFDGFVVCAESEEEALKMIREIKYCAEFIDWSGGYKVEQLEGKKEIVLESFCAG